MIIFKFRMLSDENDHFTRDYEVPSTMTLLELHDFIIETLEYEPCIASFFTADNKWEKVEEFTTVDMGFGNDSEEPVIATRPMETVTLEEIMHHIHDRLIYIFDMFANRAYYMELIEAKQSDAAGKYPKEVFAHATPPDQYDPDANQEDSSIFDEMMGDFNEFDGEDDAYEDEY